MSLLDGLNPMQKEAVVTTEGPLLLLAGAGSGKTRVLTHRIAYLIQQGVNPFHIIAITFTNKAAREMKERIEKLVAEPDGIWVSTFHSACMRILRREIHKINYDNSFTIYDADDAEKLIKSVIRELNINEKQFPPKSVMGQIGSLKDELITAESYAKMAASDYRDSIVAKVYTQYQKKLKAANALDFDDIIFKTVELFQSRPDVLYNYQERFRYIMVDEYQDTNTSQYTLVRLLSERYRNLCVVGDDDQSIYGWRGANIRNILDFEKDFPDTAVIKLEQNYRSTQTILNAANAVIHHNTARKSKELWTEKGDGALITVFKAATDLDESAYISGVIKQRQTEGASYSDFAVLYRTNAQSRAIEDSLVHQNIPYRIFGGVRFYERREIKDVLAYLRAIFNPLDEIALKRIINVPKRGIGDSTIDKISEYGAVQDLSFFDALKDVEDIFPASPRNKKITAFVELLEGLRQKSLELPVPAFIETVLEATGYRLELSKEADSEDVDRGANVDELIAKAVEYGQTAEEPSLGGFLEEVALVADIDNYQEGEEAVVLMTLHSAKGLEFPTVFIAGFEEGIFPSYRSTMSSDLNALEEERRLCYVGITRAKEQLYVTMANQRLQHGRIVYNAPSSFLKEIPLLYREDAVAKVAVKTTKSAEKEEDPEAPKSKLGSFRTAIAKGNKPAGFGGKTYSQSANIPAPKDSALDFAVGDQVRQIKYGIGEVVEILPAGADFEVTVSFPNVGNKKFMAHLSKLAKV